MIFDRYLTGIYCRTYGESAAIPQHQATRPKVVHSWWRHQMGGFTRHWPLVQIIHRPPVNSPHKGPVMRILMFLWCGSSQAVKQTVELPVIWDYMTFNWRHRNVSKSWGNSFLVFLFSNNKITILHSSDSSAVICSKLLPVCIIVVHVRNTVFARFGLWAHQPFVKRLPAPASNKAALKLRCKYLFVLP